MKIADLLIERIINAFSDHRKEQYAEEVWNLLQKSYEKIGGFKSAASVEELISDSGLWKLVVRSGKVTAVSIYKDKHGRKTIAGGSDGTVQGKNDYFMITKDDIKLHRSWSEVSGAIEHLMKKYGGTPVESKYAELLTGKKIIDFSSDGYHYTRLIAGRPHEKIIYGVVELDQASANHLKDLGISLKNLPKNIKIKD